ncbi:MAG TPA: Rieske 2Fe-2S domain-containing protein [Dehalococcoidia bacterium]|nr:Rieske 2Fe-2S domain-containing protein [Dehalococcoidia bacterium]
MLSQEDNELLCRVGPGTPMGEFMRQYWIPAIRSDELPTPDCPPLRVKLLGEELIGFRTTSGKVGLIQNACPHRGASLFFGRNEEEGLRCVYHGWKFDITGACVDMPSEPAESNFKNKVRARAYPCVERNGVIWTYMGPREVPPPLPELEGNMRSENYSVSVLYRANNWLQGIEGELDTIHAAFLHSSPNRMVKAEPGTFAYYTARSRDGKFSVRETEFGTSYGMYRPAEEDTYYWRIGHLLFPFFAMPPGASVLGEDARFLAYVPMDDYNTLEWGIGIRPPEVQSQGMLGREYIPNGTGWFERFRIKQNLQNDFLIDREEQKRGDSYTGIRGIRQQDMAMTETMGPIMDRTNEHLGTTDQMIIRTRRRYLQAVKALRDHGITPPGVDNPKAYHQRSGQVILPRNVDWWEATRDLRERFEAEAVAAPEVTRT